MARMPNEPIRSPMRESTRLSDAELLAKYDQEESGEWYIDVSHPPEGMIYEWKAVEVIGQEQPGYIPQLMRNGWRAVPASRHDGYYMPKGTEGQIVRKGQGLFELPMELAEERQRLAELRARRQVRDKEAQMIYAPPGTAPRDAHPKTMPFVRKAYERAPMDVE